MGFQVIQAFLFIISLTTVTDITLTIEQGALAFKDIHQLLSPLNAILTNMNVNN